MIGNKAEHLHIHTCKYWIYKANCNQMGQMY